LPGISGPYSRFSPALPWFNLFIPALEQAQQAEQEADDLENDDFFKKSSFQPSPIDVVVVKLFLERAARLPPELRDTIIEMAEYWPYSEARIDYKATLGDASRIWGSRTDEEDRLLVSLLLDTA
jgi:hypothetical protein